jgi:hypothetical protein
MRVLPEPSLRGALVSGLFRRRIAAFDVIDSPGLRSRGSGVLNPSKTTIAACDLELTFLIVTVIPHHLSRNVMFHKLNLEPFQGSFEEVPPSPQRKTPAEKAMKPRLVSLRASSLLRSDALAKISDGRRNVRQITPRSVVSFLA